MLTGVEAKSSAEITCHQYFLGVRKKTERRILSRTESITNVSSKKRRVDVFTTEMDEGPLLNIEKCMQDADYIPAPSFSDAETQTEMTGELLDRIEAELNETRDEKVKVVKERDELMKESKRLQHLKCPSDQKINSYFSLDFKVNTKGHLFKQSLT